jgi:hypothetical protein
MKIIEPLISALVVVLIYVCAVGFVVHAVRFVKIIVPLIPLLVLLAICGYFLLVAASTVGFGKVFGLVGTAILLLWVYGPEYDRLTGRRD